jgi:hypothetical protein
MAGAKKKTVQVNNRLATPARRLYLWTKQSLWTFKGSFFAPTRERAWQPPFAGQSVLLFLYFLSRFPKERVSALLASGFLFPCPAVQSDSAKAL